MFSGMIVFFPRSIPCRFLLEDRSHYIRHPNLIKRVFCKNGGSGFCKKIRAENVCRAVLMIVHSPSAQRRWAGNDPKPVKSSARGPNEANLFQRFQKRFYLTMFSVPLHISSQYYFRQEILSICHRIPGRFLDKNFGCTFDTLFFFFSHFFPSFFSFSGQK